MREEERHPFALKENETELERLLRLREDPEFMKSIYSAVASNTCLTPRYISGIEQMREAYRQLMENTEGPAEQAG